MNPRKTALTALDRSLLVEAGAGSGKTAIMAGRVVMLLASGVEPKRIAAITFTEFAASELMIRIGRFVDELVKGKVPPDLRIVLPDGLSASQTDNLRAGAARLDQLSCSTIHGFAQALVKPYPVEAGIDPGAEILDPSEADIAFDKLYDTWIRDRLLDAFEDGIVAQIVLVGEDRGVSLIRTIADFRRHIRDAQAECVDWSPGTFHRFAASVQQFRDDLDRYPVAEETTQSMAQGFETMVRSLAGLGLKTDSPSAANILEALNTATPASCFTGSGGPRKLQAKTKWSAAFAAAGLPKAGANVAYDIVVASYATCHAAVQTLMATLAGVILSRISDDMDGLLTEWRDYKRATAQLDFDDLLYAARDLLADHEDVRLSLGRRYLHVLVDEFQDRSAPDRDSVEALRGVGRR